MAEGGALAGVILRVGVAAGVLAAGVLGARYAEKKILTKFKRRRTPALERTVKGFKYAVYAVSAIIALSVIAKVYPVIYLFYALLAIAVLAFFDVLRNLGAGLYFKLSETVKVGDEVEVGGIEGTIARVGEEGLTLVSPKRELVYVPYSYLMRHPLINRSTGLSTLFRARILLPLERDDPSVLEKIRDAITELRGELVSDPLVYKEEEKTGFSVYVVEYELLNKRKNYYLLAKLETLLKEKLGDHVSIEA